MAKTQRTVLPALPLSEAFYGALSQVGARFGLRLSDAHALSTAVAALSQVYTRERAGLAHGALSAKAPLARLGFFLPRDLVKTFGPLTELARAGRLPRRKRLRVLDLGAGLGASSLGLARFLRHVDSEVEELEVTAIERDPQSLQLMSAVCATLREHSRELVPIALESRTTDLRRAAVPGPFDVVLLGFVLNELFLELPLSAERSAARAGLLRSLCAHLAPDGALIVLEPALKESARELMAARDALVAEPAPPFVFAPCLHSGPCPMLQRERDWCHESLGYALPPHLREIARAAGLRYEGLSYAALVLTQSPRFEDPLPLRRIVSDPLRSKGKLELYGCSEEGYVRLTRLDRDRSAANLAFETLRRGDVVELAQSRLTRATLARKR